MITSCLHLWKTNVTKFFFLQVRDACQELILSNDELLRVKEQLLVDLKKGLGKDSHDTSIVKCFPTYVQDLPNGQGAYAPPDLPHQWASIQVLYNTSIVRNAVTQCLKPNFRAVAQARSGRLLYK